MSSIGDRKSIAPCHEVARKVVLILEDRTVFQGEALAPSAKPWGKVCFNTSTTGDQEILTDTA
jgi:carbamoylphosphate synthase small subunit